MILLTRVSQFFNFLSHCLQLMKMGWSQLLLPLHPQIYAFSEKKNMSLSTMYTNIEFEKVKWRCKLIYLASSFLLCWRFSSTVAAFILSWRFALLGLKAEKRQGDMLLSVNIIYKMTIQFYTISKHGINWMCVK